MGVPSESPIIFLPGFKAENIVGIGLRNSAGNSTRNTDESELSNAK